ncbi:MAG: bifunctional phosphopantothenoylcysteine decarboxylase/phosphopantothenate--cysteine ligase CoaBC [Bdellovibrionales bacterium]|nr:bifunctional phosphopantothenoylcysteine decarboxylase/phosphopantothenate--cysteine ligase CoaBC [Bdellovibrionales bacterium]
MSEKNEKRKVLLGVTGSIAAYKAAELARIFVSRGYEVRVAMTRSAQEFISAMTMRAITSNDVMLDFWETEGRDGIEHIETADWADAIVIAPATADCIAKLAQGISDNPLLAACLASKAPLVVAPAMNVNMLEHPGTQQNLSVLRDRGVRIIDPEEGELACGWHGSGRLAAPWQIFYEVRRALSDQDLAGKQILISTGPTREAIDPVRFISNRSSGKMGVALAREAFRRGAEVTLVHGPCTIKVPTAVRCIPVTTAEEMRVALHQQTYEGAVHPDVVVMAAAVTDYRPSEVAAQKIKRDGQKPQLELVENIDILAELSGKRSSDCNPLFVGFAVETGEEEDLLANVRSKIEKKKVDVIVGNFADDAFGSDTNRVWIVDRFGKQEEVAVTYKSRIANRILSVVSRLI